MAMVIGHPHSAGFPGLQAWPARPNSHFNLQMVYYWLLAHDEHVMYFVQEIVLCYYLCIIRFNKYFPNAPLGKTFAVPLGSVGSRCSQNLS